MATGRQQSQKALVLAPARVAAVRSTEFLPWLGCRWGKWSFRCRARPVRFPTPQPRVPSGERRGDL
eukprot:9490490-Pyramimonas_sp.AAC.1